MSKQPGPKRKIGGSIMKTKGNILAVGVAIIALTVGTAGSSLAFGGWPYPGHTTRPDLEERNVVQAASSVQDDEWGKNMPEYGWIHNYVEAKRAERGQQKKGKGAAVTEGSGPQSPTEKTDTRTPAPEGPKGE
jgi:hypothetical protein